MTDESALSSKELLVKLEREKLYRALAAKKFDPYFNIVSAASVRSFSPSWFTKYINDTIQEFIDDSIAGKSPRIILTCPPRHGKTQATGRALPGFFAAYVKQSQAIYVTSTDALAQNNGADARGIIESDEFKRVFNVELDSEHRSRDDMRLNNGSRIRFTSVGAALHGYGGEIIVVDDYFRNDYEANSKLERDGVFNWFQGTLFNRIHPGGGIIITATRWHVDDPIGRIIVENNKLPLDAPSRWKVLEFPAIAKKDEEFRKEGECLSPRITVADLAIRRREAGERNWSSLFQCSPYIESGNFFNVPLINWYEGNMPTNLSFGVGADYATSEKSSADKSAVVPCGINTSRDVYVAPDYFYGRVDADSAVDNTIKLAKKYKTAVLCHEKGVIANLLKSTFRRAMDANRHWVVTERYARRHGKHIYAIPIQALITNGKLYLPASRRKELEPLFLSFSPDADGEDDFIDGLASFCMCMDKIQIEEDLPQLPSALPAKDTRSIDEIQSEHFRERYQRLTENLRDTGIDAANSDSW